MNSIPTGRKMFSVCSEQEWISVITICLIATLTEGRQVLVNKDRYESSVNLIQTKLSAFEEAKAKVRLSNESQILASNFIQLLESNAKEYEAFIQKSVGSLPGSLIEFDPYGNQSLIIGVGNVRQSDIHGSILALYGLGSYHKKKPRRDKRGVPAIVGGVLGGAVGGCVGAADLFFLPLVGGLTGGLFGAGAGAGAGGVIELNPLAAPLNSLLGGVVGALLAAVGGGLGGIAGPAGGCAGGAAGGAVGAGVGTVLATVLQLLLGGPF